jgi:hypothetical protein
MRSQRLAAIPAPIPRQRSNRMESISEQNIPGTITDWKRSGTLFKEIGGRTW